MVDDERYEKIIRHSLKEELRFLNGQIPGKQKSLQALLDETSPAVNGTDGSLQLIKRKELLYLSELIPASNWNFLLLPVIIEVNPGGDEINIVCRGDEEVTVFSAILGMPVRENKQRIRIYKPQLAAIRKVLKTTTQYLFSPKILQ